MKRPLLTALAAISLAAATLAGTPAALAQGKTLRMVPYADLKVLDPFFTTAYITRNFGFMVYDTLFAPDAKGVPQPQMVSAYKTSDDGKQWTFTLRDGLKFSDGTPVRAADCVASLQRWQKRDNIGVAMTAAGGQWQAVDDKTFTLTLQKPFGLVLDGLAKVASYPAFILPERLARMPDTAPLNEVVGSGPYVFKRDEWVPGSKLVFLRNPQYVGRSEPPNGLAGNKTSHVDRVEWMILPDSNSAIAALKNNEVDMIEEVPADYIQPLRSDPDIRVGVTGNTQAYIIANFLYPPFNNAKARQALLHAVDQDKFTTAMGYPDDMRLKYCATFFICGSPSDTQAGSAPYAKPDMAMAKRLLAESGYKGEKVVVLLPTDVAYLNSATLVAIQAMQEMGMNVDIQAMDWATETARRAKKTPVDQGGWNIYLSSAAEYSVNSPINSTYLGAACGNGLPGWPCDTKLDELRAQWIAATDPAGRKELLDRFQERAYEAVPYIPVGQYSRVYAVRKTLAHSDQLWGLPNVWVLDK
jgi:peptide/nickel transport system substrate-binding protein